MTDEKNKPKRENEDSFDFKQEIASRIKALREQRKYTPEKLSKKTKVPIRVIHEIEEASDDFYKEKVFAYGFIKIICKEFKVPSDQLLELCEKCFPQTNNYLDSVEDFKALASKKQSKNLSFVSKVFQWNNLKSLSLAIMFFFVASFLYTLFQGNEQGQQHSASAPSGHEKIEEQKELLDEEKDKIASALETKTDDSKKDDEAKKEDQPNPEQASVSATCPKPTTENQGRKCLSLRVKAPTKLIATADKKPGVERLFEPGIYHFYYNESLEFTLDDASQVELLEGEKNWGVLSQRKEKKRIKFFNRDFINPEAMPELKL